MNLFNKGKDFVTSKFNNIVGTTGVSSLGGEYSDQINTNLKSFFGNDIYNTKSIQKVWKFILTFQGISEVDLQAFHVLKCTLPINYGWKVEPVKIGPYVYGVPVMDFNGFNINVTLEEDDKGTITSLIYLLQKKIMSVNSSGNFNGNYSPQSSNRIFGIGVDIYDDLGEKVFGVLYKDAFFLEASTINLDYDATDSMKYDITFYSPFIEITFNKLDELSDTPGNNKYVLNYNSLANINPIG